MGNPLSPRWPVLPTRIHIGMYGKTHSYLNSHYYQYIGENPHMQTQPHIYSQFKHSHRLSHMHTQAHRDMGLTMPHIPPNTPTHCDVHNCLSTAQAVHTHTHTCSVVKTNVHSHLLHPHTYSLTPVSYSLPTQRHSVSTEFSLSQTPPNAGTGLYWSRVNSRFTMRIPLSYP